MQKFWRLSWRISAKWRIKLMTLFLWKVTRKQQVRGSTLLGCCTWVRPFYQSIECNIGQDYKIFSLHIYHQQYLRIIYISYQLSTQDMLDHLLSCLTTYFLLIAGAVVLVLCLIKYHFRGGKYHQDQIDLSGKNALITGGNSGIGAETVKYFVSLGCSVIIGARDRKTAEVVIK